MWRFLTGGKQEDTPSTTEEQQTMADQVLALVQRLCDTLDTFFKFADDTKWYTATREQLITAADPDKSATLTKTQQTFLLEFGDLLTKRAELVGRMGDTETSQLIKFAGMPYIISRYCTNSNSIQAGLATRFSMLVMGMYLRDRLAPLANTPTADDFDWLGGAINAERRRPIALPSESDIRKLMCNENVKLSRSMSNVLATVAFDTNIAALGTRWEIVCELVVLIQKVGHRLVEHLASSASGEPVAKAEDTPQIVVEEMEVDVPAVDGMADAMVVDLTRPPGDDASDMDCTSDVDCDEKATEPVREAAVTMTPLTKMERASSSRMPSDSESDSESDNDSASECENKNMEKNNSESESESESDDDSPLESYMIKVPTKNEDGVSSKRRKSEKLRPSPIVITTPKQVRPTRKKLPPPKKTQAPPNVRLQRTRRPVHTTPSPRPLPVAQEDDASSFTSLRQALRQSQHQ